MTARSALYTVPTNALTQPEAFFLARSPVVLMEEANHIALADLLLKKAISESDEPALGKPCWGEEDRALFNDCMEQIHVGRVPEQVETHQD